MDHITPPAPAEQELDVKLPPGFVATRLVASLRYSKRSICYVALSEGEAGEIAEAIGIFFPDIEPLVLPPWDCLPYDRVPPSRHCMGLRMDALRIWNEPSPAPRLLVTSLEATLQRVPPATVIVDSQLELVVGNRFDRDRFSSFIQRTGYVEEGVADDPGEVAVRDGVIDIYPAGAPGPMRIVLSEDDVVRELKGFDRISQRTESFLDKVTFGPASEAILDQDPADNVASNSDTMERLLCRLYEDMPSVFNVIGDAAVYLAPGAEERVDRYLEIIEDARQARRNFGGADNPSSQSLYLDRAEWDRQVRSAETGTLDLKQGSDLPRNRSDTDPRRALFKFVQEGLERGRKVVVAGKGKRSEALCRRLANATGTQARTIDTWESGLQAEPGALLKLRCDLERGFVDLAQNIAVVPAPEMPNAFAGSNSLLMEPELQIGDVVVHEDHGVGVLTDLESILVEDVPRDAARLVYRDGNSVLVPLEEFGRLWRYGSEPEAVTLDRLNSDAWEKKRQKIAADIHSAARHLLAVAKKRQLSRAEKFVPPRAEFLAFTRRFPFTETRDQAEAINAVTADLASGSTMNRLICGDVGFGKTEIALRAAAAVALAGGQVVVIVPTTVLARQHYATFERRFSGTGIAVGMLSRLVKSSEAKQVKAALASGKIGVVVATQAILGKDIDFTHLGLLIVDEEHRFGLKEKQGMNALAPFLHRLAMSATPIPRTLQAAMVGVQEVSLLTTPPVRRRPVRTSLASFDSASMRIGLMREHRRKGQSFVVVPRVDEIEVVEAILRKLVPELSIKVAHGKMPAAAIDEAIVSFAEGDDDVLLATNIIENGLDVPRANTMYVWHADMFGLAQLHQLRGRVGRGGAQGMVTLLTKEGADLPEETRLRLATLIENDRLGSGLAISLRDLDLRGGGDLASEDQAGHLSSVGIGLYQSLLAGAVARLRRQPSATRQRATLNIGFTGMIPADYVPDPAVRLNLYAKLLRASSLSDLNDLEEELEDRFGELPQNVMLLLRTTRLQLSAGQLGITKLEAGPKALAVTLTAGMPTKTVNALVEATGGVQREDRIIWEAANLTGEEQLRSFERIVAAVRLPKRRTRKR